MVIKKCVFGPIAFGPFEICDSPILATKRDNALINEWIKIRDLNEHGYKKGKNFTVDEAFDQGLILTIDRYDYIKEKNNASWIPVSWS